MARPTSRVDAAWDAYLVLVQMYSTPGRIVDPMRLANRAFLLADAFEDEVKRQAP